MCIRDRLCHIAVNLHLREQIALPFNAPLPLLKVRGCLLYTSDVYKRQGGQLPQDFIELRVRLLTEPIAFDHRTE